MKSTEWARSPHSTTSRACTGQAAKLLHEVYTASQLALRTIVIPGEPDTGLTYRKIMISQKLTTVSIWNFQNECRINGYIYTYTIYPSTLPGTYLIAFWACFYLDQGSITICHWIFTRFVHTLFLSIGFLSHSIWHSDYYWNMYFSSILFHFLAKNEHFLSFSLLAIEIIQPECRKKLFKSCLIRRWINKSIFIKLIFQIKISKIQASKINFIKSNQQIDVKSTAIDAYYNGWNMCKKWGWYSFYNIVQCPESRKRNIF